VRVIYHDNFTFVFPLFQKSNSPFVMKAERPLPHPFSSSIRLGHWSLLLVSVLMGAVLLSSCDLMSSEDGRPQVERELLGSWRVDAQKTTFSVLSTRTQTVLDPDVPAEGSMRLTGTWLDDNTLRSVDRRLRYVRYTARSRIKPLPRLVLSTQPVTNEEARILGQEEGFVVELADNFDAESGLFQFDGLLEGEVNSTFEKYPGTQRIGMDDSVRAPSLVAPPVAENPGLELSSVPFGKPTRRSPDLPEDDTVRVDGRLKAPTQTVSAGRETVVDVQEIDADWLDERKITYTFQSNDTVRVRAVSALDSRDTLTTRGTWSVDGDTLTLRDDETTARAAIERTETGLRLRFQSVELCPAEAGEGSECRRYHESRFGLRPGTLKEARSRLVNHVKPIDEAKVAQGQVAAGASHSPGPGATEAGGDSLSIVPYHAGR
jgi:hypothetical protein